MPKGGIGKTERQCGVDPYAAPFHGGMFNKSGKAGKPAGGVVLKGNNSDRKSKAGKGGRGSY